MTAVDVDLLAAVFAWSSWPRIPILWQGRDISRFDGGSTTWIFPALRIEPFEEACNPPGPPGGLRPSRTIYDAIGHRGCLSFPIPTIRLARRGNSYALAAREIPNVVGDQAYAISCRPDSPIVEARMMGARTRPSSWRY